MNKTRTPEQLAELNRRTDELRLAIVKLITAVDVEIGYVAVAEAFVMASQVLGQDPVGFVQSLTSQAPDMGDLMALMSGPTGQA